MKFGKAFNYIFKDPDWFKKIIGPALCMLIPVIGQLIFMGYLLKVTKNVIGGDEDSPLPQLDFGADLGKGFMGFLITFIYLLPVSIIGGIAGGMSGAMMNADETMMIVLGILGACLGIIALVIGLLISLIMPIAIANYAATYEFGAAFRFKELFGMLKSSFVSWLLVLVGGLLAGLIAPLGLIACGIGVLLTAAYAGLVNYHLIGQAYNVSKAPKLGEIEV